MIHAHTAYGLTFHLPFLCPLLPTAALDAEPDVTVVEGPVPRQLDAPLAEQETWQAESDRFLFKAGRNAGRYLVESGNRITLERSPMSDDETLAFCFLEAVLPAALRQNHFLVLHANSVATLRGAVAIGGESGAGKSTTTAALLRRGCSLLADDVTVLRAGPNGGVEVLPGAPQFSLCPDAIDSLGQDPTGLSRHRRRSTKFVIPAHASMAADPSNLRALYFLRPYDGSEVCVRQLRGAEKFDAVQDSIYGPMLPHEHSAHFPLFAALTERVKVFRLDRPANRWTADAVAEALLHV
jgi:hypothetical protein